MRKEYNDRWNAPLVNPGFTMEQYENSRLDAAIEAEKRASIRAQLETQNHYEQVKARSEAIARLK